jgi:hypothetical protein
LKISQFILNAFNICALTLNCVPSLLFCHSSECWNPGCTNANLILSGSHLYKMLHLLTPYQVWGKLSSPLWKSRIFLEGLRPQTRYSPKFDSSDEQLFLSRYIEIGPTIRLNLALRLTCVRIQESFSSFPRVYFLSPTRV